MNSGSVEQHTYLLSEALAKRGHKVTLFATKDADCPPGVKLSYVFRSTPKNYYNLDTNHVFARNFIQVTTALENSKKYDYISCHTMTGIAVMELLKSQGIPIVGSTSIHWQTRDKRLQPLLSEYPHHPLIAVSKHMNNYLKDRNNVAGVIRYGLKLKEWPYKSKKQDYILFVGKIIPEKGVDLVVQAAKIANLPLIIAGRRIDERYPDFFDKEIKPYLNDKIKYVGEVVGKEKLKLFKNAFAFVSPGRWEEPFGIVFIEAQACGTPVIAWNPGSSNDSIINGKTGFAIKAKDDKNAIKQIVRALTKIPKIKPIDCRNNVKEHYTIEKTAEKYEQIMYRQIEAENKI